MGSVRVSGRRRVPSPPARMTAFIASGTSIGGPGIIHRVRGAVAGALYGSYQGVLVLRSLTPRGASIFSARLECGRAVVWREESESCRSQKSWPGRSAARGTPRDHRSRLRRTAARGGVRAAGLPRHRLRPLPERSPRSTRGESYIKDVDVRSAWRALVARGHVCAPRPTSTSWAAATPSSSACPRRSARPRTRTSPWSWRPPRRSRERLRPGQLVVLESTTYPGTTEELILPHPQRSAASTSGESFFLAFSPERVDPGNAQLQHPQHAEGRRRHDAHLHAHGAGALRAGDRHGHPRLVAPGRRRWSSCSRTPSAA